MTLHDRGEGALRTPARLVHEVVVRLRPDHLARDDSSACARPPNPSAPQTMATIQNGWVTGSLVAIAATPKPMATPKLVITLDHRPPTPQSAQLPAAPMPHTSRLDEIAFSNSGGGSRPASAYALSASSAFSFCRDKIQVRIGVMISDSPAMATTLMMTRVLSSITYPPRRGAIRPALRGQPARTPLALPSPF